MLKINVKDYFNQLIYIMRNISGDNIVYNYDFSKPMLSGPEEDSSYITICQLYEEVDEEYDDEGIHILLSMELELSKIEVDRWMGTISDSYMCGYDEILYCFEDQIWNSPLYFILGRYLQYYEESGLSEMKEEHYIDYADGVLKTYYDYCEMESRYGCLGGYSLQMN